MKLHSKKVSDNLTREWHLSFPKTHEWGFLTIILMLAVIAQSIEINPSTIVYAIPIQVASTIFLFGALIKKRNIWHDEED